MLISVSKEHGSHQPAISSPCRSFLLNHSFLLLQGCAFRLSLFTSINAVHQSGYRCRGLILTDWEAFDSQGRCEHFPPCSLIGNNSQPPFCLICQKEASSFWDSVLWPLSPWFQFVKAVNRKMLFILERFLFSGVAQALIVVQVFAHSVLLCPCVLSVVWEEQL